MKTKLNVSKEKLDELVETISLSEAWIVRGIPTGELNSLKKELESSDKLSDYKFEYQKILGKNNVLVATKNYGVNQNA